MTRLEILYALREACSNHINRLQDRLDEQSEILRAIDRDIDAEEVRCDQRDRRARRERFVVVAGGVG